MQSICTAVVTYNRLDLLKGAIESLKAQTQPTDILVVNNGSTDGTKDYLESLSGITVIHQENVGGAGGFHTAMKYIAEHGYDFAWVMDDDIIAAPDTLQELYEAYKYLSEKEKIGFLCSTVLSADGDTVNVPAISDSKNPTGYPDWNHLLDKGLVKVKTATFVSVFLSTDIIREVGLPIKEFFIWGDDTEYTQRISSKYPCYLVSKSKITHLRNGGALNLWTIDDPNRIKMFRNYVRNNLYNQRKYSGRTLFYIISHIKLALQFIINGKFNKTATIIKGLNAGISFNPRVLYPKETSNK